MNLRECLSSVGAKQVDLAEYLSLARSTVCGICNGNFPVGREEELKEKINGFLESKGLKVKVQFHSVKKEAEKEIKEEYEEEEWMKVEMLTMDAKKHFGLFKDPFVDDIHDKSDVYLTDSIRYVSEYMYVTAKSAGMLAVVGESGSGKSTLRRMLIDRISESDEKIKVIFPRTLDRTKLTAASICDAIIADLSGQTPKRSIEAKCRQVEKVLTESSRAGWSHVLMIEEAHDLSVLTLKYLKRFWEMEDGFKRLLGIILIAQPELKPMLDESRNWEARELIRRMEVAELDSFMIVEEVKGYLECKMKKAGSCVERIFTEDAYPAILEAMTRKTKSGHVTRFCYPLSVNNLVRRAMNEASSIFEPKVSAEVIKRVL